MCVACGPVLQKEVQFEASNEYLEWNTEMSTSNIGSRPSESRRVTFLPRVLQTVNQSAKNEARVASTNELATEIEKGN